MPFRLFDLPLIPRRHIFKCFEVIDLLDLSWSSKNSASIITSSRKMVLKIDIIVDATERVFRFHSGRLVFTYAPVAWYPQLRFFKLENHKLWLGKTYPDSKIQSELPHITMKVMLAELDKIYDCKCSIELHGSCERTGQVTDYLRLTSHFESFQCNDWVMEDEDVKYILEDLRVSETGKLLLTTRLRPESEFQSENAVLTAKNIYLSVVKHVINPSSFLASDCETLLLHAVDFPTETFELFVSRWLEGGWYKRARDVRVRNHSNLIILEVLKTRGIAWDPKQRGRYFIINEWYAADCAEGTDILRSDGTLATFYTLHKKFRMFVWHEKFPKLSEQHKIVPVDKLR